MKYFIAIALLAAAASASPLDFHPTSHLGHPSISPNLRIVGGEEMPAHQAPYQAILFFPLFICAGTLISDLYVLTTAQCAIHNHRPEILLGAHRIEDNEPEQRDYQAVGVIFHPQWDNHLVNNIALAKFPERIRFTDAIRPIALAPPNAGSFENELVRVTGWGTMRDGKQNISPYLRYYLNPIVNKAVCEERLGRRMDDGEMCLSGQGGKSPCVGDLGAPAVGIYNNRLVLVGMVSYYKQGQCEAGFPVGLIRISRHYKWILHNMENTEF